MDSCSKKVRYELSRQAVDHLRETVKEQMMKYNFDTMLGEWGTFGALDVLKAMRPKPDRIDKKLNH